VRPRLVDCLTGKQAHRLGKEFGAAVNRIMRTAKLPRHRVTPVLSEHFFGKVYPKPVAGDEYAAALRWLQVESLPWFLSH